MSAYPTTDQVDIFARLTQADCDQRAAAPSPVPSTKLVVLTDRLEPKPICQQEQSGKIPL